nr:RusA family crossover junction endodeoxyribonuclease [Ligilactobacillus salivarius]
MIVHEEIDKYYSDEPRIEVEIKVKELKNDEERNQN